MNSWSWVKTLICLEFVEVSEVVLEVGISSISNSSELFEGEGSVSMVSIYRFCIWLMVSSSI
jgi:hypothetical protein